MSDDAPSQPPLSRRTRFALSAAVGLLFAALAGLGVVFHDGKPWSEGLLTGAGFFAFGFIFAYVRYARRLAEMLSIFH